MRQQRGIQDLSRHLRREARKQSRISLIEVVIVLAILATLALIWMSPQRGF